MKGKTHEGNGARDRRSSDQRLAMVRMTVRAVREVHRIISDGQDRALRIWMGSRMITGTEKRASEYSIKPPEMIQILETMNLA